MHRVIFRKSLLLTILIVSSSVNAQSGKNNIGGNIDYVLASGACESQVISCTDTDVGWSIFYERDVYDTFYLGIGYDDLGEYKADYPALGNPNEIAPYSGNVSGFELYSGYRFPVTNGHAFSTAIGALFWNTDVEGDESGTRISRDDSGTSPFLSLGYAWNVSHNLSVNLGYQFIYAAGSEDTGGANLNVFSLGVSYRFGAEPVVAAVSPPPPPPVVVLSEPQTKIIVERSMSVMLGGGNSLVLFEFDSSELSNEMVKALSPMLARLIQYPDANLTIESHTDNRGSEEYNLALSVRRADSVKQYFVKNGIDASRIVEKSYGESRPIADNSTEENRAMNRRVALFSPAFNREVAL